MSEPNCYSCKWRGKVCGSAHSNCNHPSVKAAHEDAGLQIASIFAGVGRCAPVIMQSKELNIKANPHGIKNGWFNFPLNFDPRWLENCDGYEKQE